MISNTGNRIMFEVGERVCREVDIYEENGPLKYGVVLERYNEKEKTFYLPPDNEPFTLGPYPELYKVQWDDGKIENGFLPHGLTLVEPI
jgi:hypothetical protein